MEYSYGANYLVFKKRKHEIEGSPWEGKVRIGLRRFELRDGILIHNGMLVKNISPLSLRVDKRKIDCIDELYFKILEFFKDTEVKNVSISVDGIFYEVIKERFEYKGGLMRIELEDHDRTNIYYTGKNIYFHVTIRHYEDADGMHRVNISLGPFTSWRRWDANSDRISSLLRGGRKRVTLKKFIDELVALDSMNWPGTNIPFMAKNVYKLKKKDKVAVNGRTLLSDVLYSYVYSDNVIYITSADLYPLATLFTSSVRFEPVVKGRKIYAKFEENLYQVYGNSLYVSDIMRNFEVAKEINENRDLIEEFRLVEF